MLNSTGAQKETHIGKKTEVDEREKHPPHTHTHIKKGQKANATDNQVRCPRLVFLTHPLFIEHLPQVKLCSVCSGSNRRVGIVPALVDLPLWWGKRSK